MHIHLPTVTSTMDEAARRVRQGDTTTTSISADEQTLARGRHGRPWQTFPGHSLAVTFILRPAQGPHLPLIAALALHQAVSSLITNHQSPVTIKWPNDLLLNGKKLAGILCENLGAQASLVGMGVNLTRPEEGSIPPEFTGTFLCDEISSTSSFLVPRSSFLSENVIQPAKIGKNRQKSAANRSHLPLIAEISTCLAQLLDLYELHGWSALHNNYLRHCVTIGNKVRWKTAQQQELTGIARGLNEGGQLEMVAEDGTVHVIHSGEIIEYKQ